MVGAMEGSLKRLDLDASLGRTRARSRPGKCRVVSLVGPLAGGREKG
jgi:hypothetical protein